MLEVSSQLLVVALATFGIYALASLGFLLIYIPGRFFNFVAGIPILATPYMAYLIGQLTGSFLLGCLLSVIVAGAAGATTYATVFRRLDAAGLPPTIQLVATLGIYTATVGIVALAFGQQSIRIYSWSVSSFELAFETRVSLAQAMSIILAITIILTFHFTWTRTRAGLQLRAIADDPSLAHVVGVPVSRFASRSFAIGFILLGMAGILTALDSAVRPTFAFPLLVVAMVAAAVGQGRKRLSSALGASGLIAIAETVVAASAGESWARATSLLFLVLILVWGGERRRQPARQV